MVPEIKDAVDKFNREWEEMKGVMTAAAAEAKVRGGELHPETKAKIDGFNARLDEMELKLQRPAAGSRIIVPSEESTREAKAAFDKYVRKGVRDPQAIEKKILTVSDESTGGVFAPAEIVTDLIKGTVEISPVRQLVRVRTTSNRSVKVMKRTGTFAAVWVGETDTRSETTGLTYGMEEIPAHEIYALVDISNQDLEDSYFNWETELVSEAAEQFAYAEGAAVTNGTGNKKPEGWMTNAAVSNDVTGDANNLTYAGLVDVSHNGKVVYLNNSRFVFRLSTLGKIRQMVDGDGTPLWAPMQSGAPASILGFPYTIVQDMPAATANLFPVAFGDFARAYQMVDRVTIEVQRDPFTQNTKGVTRFIIRKRVGGQVVLAEAIRKLKVSA